MAGIYYRKYEEKYEVTVKVKSLVEDRFIALWSEQYEPDPKHEADYPEGLDVPRIMLYMNGDKMLCFGMIG